MTNLAQQILHHLKSVRILPRRILLSTPGVQASVPMLRGCWGAALHAANFDVYTKVFNPENSKPPLYLLRPGPDEPRENPCLDFFLFNEAIADDATLLKAWGKACRNGLGPNRNPFFINGYVLNSFYVEASPDQPWNLGEAEWPLQSDPADTPCRISFSSPLRILRNKHLIEEPTLADIVVAIHRRLDAFIPDCEAWRTLQRDLLSLARNISCIPWDGQRLDLVRWSSRQQEEVEMRGVYGELILPEGPGDLWPLLAAAQWTHLGKGTIMGLGQPVITYY